MTDITELAQSMKAAAEHYQSVQGIARYSKTADAKERFVELANPANVLALVEAVEKSQAKNALVAGGIEAATKLHERIAYLESRTVTVKLASRRLPSDYVDGEFGNDDLAAIHNACRLECKVSVEKYLSAHGIVVKWEAE